MVDVSTPLLPPGVDRPGSGGGDPEPAPRRGRRRRGPTEGGRTSQAWFAGGGVVVVAGFGLWLVSVLTSPVAGPGRQYVGPDRDIAMVGYGALFVLVAVLGVALVGAGRRWREVAAAALVGVAPWLVERLAGVLGPGLPGAGARLDAAALVVMLLGALVVATGLARPPDARLRAGAPVSLTAAAIGAGTVVVASLLPHDLPARPVELVAVGLAGGVAAVAARMRPAVVGAAVLAGFAAAGELHVAAVVGINVTLVGRDYLLWTMPALAAGAAVAGAVGLAVLAWRMSEELPGDPGPDDGPPPGLPTRRGRIAVVTGALLALTGAGVAAAAPHLSTVETGVHPRLVWWFGAGYLALVAVAAVVAIVRQGLVSAAGLVGVLAWGAPLVAGDGPAAMAGGALMVLGYGAAALPLVRHAVRHSVRVYAVVLAAVAGLGMVTTAVVLGARTGLPTALAVVAFAGVPALSAWARPSRLGVAGLGLWLLAALPALATLLVAGDRAGYAVAAALAVVALVAAWLVWLVLTNADAHAARAAEPPPPLGLRLS